MGTLKKTRGNSDAMDADTDTVVFKVPDLPKQTAVSKNRSENKSIIGSSHCSKAICMETYEFGKNVRTTNHSKVDRGSTSGESATRTVVLDYEKSVDNLDKEENDNDSNIDNDHDKSDDKQENCS